MLKTTFKWKYLRARLYLEKHKYRSYFWPLGLFLLIAAGLIISFSLAQQGVHWLDWQAGIGNAHTFCEHDRAGAIVRQPMNTWSNFAYLFVGLVCITMGLNDYNYNRKQIKNSIVARPIFSILMGVSAIYLFIGSFFFHASLTRVFQKLDQTGIYAVMFSILAYNLYLLFPYFKHKGQKVSSHLIILIGTLVLNLLFFFWLWKVNVNVLFPIVVVLTFGVQFVYARIHGNSHKFVRYFKVAILVLLAAGFVWIMDKHDFLCSPESIFQGHAVWHILTATSIFFIYLYYRSRQIPEVLMEENAA